jgi:hypothetical protein
MPDDFSPLTLDSAVSLLAVTPGQNAEATLEDNPAAKIAADSDQAAQPNPAEADASPEAAAAEGETDTPADQGETNEGEADPGDALPPIDPPTSWSTEEKAEWNSLSRKAQETILRREQDATKALRNAQNSTAESNKKVEAEVNRLKGLTERIDGYLNEKVAELSKDFPDIRSEQDMIALSKTDPARVQEFQVRLQALASAQNAKAQAQQEIAQKTEAQQKEEFAKAKEALIEAFPTWKDPDVARREITELQEYAIKLGVPEAAARSAIDPMTYKLAHKAMLYDRAQAAKEKAVQRVPPRTVKPGAQQGNPATAGKDEARRNQLVRLEKSGDIDDARGLLRI